jgi:hypothetical protein
MQKIERSLRFIVRKWLVMAAAVSVRVTHGSRARKSEPHCMRRCTALSRRGCNLFLLPR